MTKKKKIAIIIYLLMFPISITLATQIFAKYVGYAKGLGDPLFIINRIPFYPPFKIIEWQIYRNQAPIAFEKALTSGGITLVIFVFLIGFLTKKKHVETSHGAASFATQEDIKKMKLFPNEKDVLKNYDKEGMTQIYKEVIYNNFPLKIANEDFKTNGIVIGQDEKGNYLYDNQPGHVILAAQTGSGKGIGLVLPTLWTWKESGNVMQFLSRNAILHQFSQGEGRWHYKSIYLSSDMHRIVQHLCSEFYDGINRRVQDTLISHAVPSISVQALLTNTFHTIVEQCVGTHILKV